MIAGSSRAGSRTAGLTMTVKFLEVAAA